MRLSATLFLTMVLTLFEVFILGYYYGPRSTGSKIQSAKNIRFDLKSHIMAQYLTQFEMEKTLFTQH